MSDLFAAVADDRRARRSPGCALVLAGRAEAEGLLDVAYRTVDSPLGALLLAATPVGLVRVAFEGEDHDDVLGDLADDVSPRVLLAPARLDDVARQLDEYFAGRRRALRRAGRPAARPRLPPCRARAPAGRSPTARPRATPTWPRAAGSPNAVRAAGSACATNPVPLVVPCHRVVRSDGSIGQYRGGVEAKRLLLALEAA